MSTSNTVESLIRTMIEAIVDEPSGVVVSEVPSPNGNVYEVKVSKSDVGKIIGKQGRIANAIRTVAKAAGAKAGQRVMVNVLNNPV
jgi:predicted RNA-binding protein YlqC (UPF0109 family)